MRKIILFVLLFVSTAGFPQKTLFCLARQYGFDSRDPEEIRGCAPIDNIYNYWDVGKTLNVKFLNGNQKIKAAVEKISREWEQFANVKFLFVGSGPAQIRIHFNNSGYLFAANGLQANIMPEDEATVEIDTSFFTSAGKMRAIVLHVFGHVLGLQHEVKVPVKGRQWKQENVKRYFLPMGWDQEKIVQRVINAYSVSYSNGLMPDLLSVMNIPIPSNWTNEKESNWNTALSINDKKLIELIYPKQSQKHSSSEPSLLVNEFTEIKTSQLENGLLFRPVFQIFLKNIQSFTMYVKVLDKNGNVIDGTDETPLVISKHFFNLKDNQYSINYGSNDVGFFLPFKQIPTNFRRKKLKAIFKIYQYDYATDKKLTYSSEHYEFMLSE